MIEIITHVIFIQTQYCLLKHSQSHYNYSCAAPHRIAQRTITAQLFLLLLVTVECFNGFMFKVSH